MRRCGWATATVEDELSQQVARAALRAEAHLGGVVLSLQTEASLPCVDPCGLGDVGDRRDLVQDCAPGRAAAGKLQARQWTCRMVDGREREEDVAGHSGYRGQVSETGDAV